MTPTTRDGGLAVCGACGASWTWAKGESPAHDCPTPELAMTVAYEAGDFSIGPAEPTRDRFAIGFDLAHGTDRSVAYLCESAPTGCVSAPRIILLGDTDHPADIVRWADRIERESFLESPAAREIARQVDAMLTPITLPEPTKPNRAMRRKLQRGRKP